MKERLYLLWLVVAVVFLAACGGGGAAVVDEAANVDEESGLIVNPDERDIGEPYIVEGEIKSMNLTPATAPEFLVVVSEGRQYRILTQPLDQITYQDGAAIEASALQIGMPVRATVEFDAEGNGGLGSLVSTDFQIQSE